MRLPDIASRRHPCIASSTRLRNTSGMCSPLLARDGLKFGVRERTDLRVVHKHPRTSVPAQDSVVVSMRPESLSSFVVFHGLPQCMIGIRMAAKLVVVEMRVSLSFPHETGVIGALVLALDTGKHLFCRFHRKAMVQLVGSRQQQRNDRLLMGRQNRQNV